MKIKNKTCENCNNISLKRFRSSDDYLSAIEHLKKLLESGGFELAHSACPFDSIKDKDGCWYQDVIAHSIICKKCGTTFICSYDNYHGNGRIRIE